MHLTGKCHPSPTFTFMEISSRFLLEGKGKTVGRHESLARTSGGSGAFGEGYGPYQSYPRDRLDLSTAFESGPSFRVPNPFSLASSRRQLGSSVPLPSLAHEDERRSSTTSAPRLSSSSPRPASDLLMTSMRGAVAPPVAFGQEIATSPSLNAVGWSTESRVASTPTRT